MATKISGQSDDTIVVSGDITGECYTRQNDKVLLFCNDGTMLEVRFTKRGIWRIHTLVAGTLFKNLVPYRDCGEIPSDDQDFSDIAYFADGLTQIICAYKYGIVS